MILELIVSHKNCLDGHSCVAIKQGISSLKCNSKLNIYSWPIFINPSENIGTSLLFKIIIWLLSWFIAIQIVFTDITPPNIIDIVMKYKYIKFELYDHHHTQKSLVSELEKLNLSNISITFNSESKFGAVKMLVDKYKHLLTKEQILFFTKIGACDMWNKEEFPDFIYFLFGYYNYCDEFLSKKIHNPLELWKISYFGSDFINSNINSGKKYYNEVEIILNKWIEKNIDKIIINYKDNCKILFFNNSEFIEPYNISINMTSILSYYLDNNRKWNINVLAIYKSSLSDYVSLRNIGSEDYDVSTIAKLCDGGGHKKASSCKLNKLKELFKII